MNLKTVTTPNNLKTLTRPLKIKTLSDNGEFAGYGSVFGEEDSVGDVVERGAFLNSIATRGAAGIKFLWQHRPDEPIGVYTKIIEDERGLYVEGRLLIDGDPLAARAYAHLKAGSLDGLSIGYRTIDSNFDRSTGITTLFEIDLWEVSLVTFPALTTARISDVKTIREFERSLRDELGYSRKEAEALARQGFNGLKLQRDAGMESDGVPAALSRLANIVSK